MNIRFVLARLWYLLVGSVATLVGVGAVVGPLAGGCRIALSQRDMDLPIDPSTGASCVQYVDPVVTALTVVVGLLALAAAAWVTSNGGVRRSVARAGIVIGLLASAVPALLLGSVLGFYDVAPGPMEILIGALPIALGVAAALVMWPQLGRARESMGTGNTLDA